MIHITYPDPAPSLRKEEGKEQVFCRPRKKWVALTPEEWVRQNFINYLEKVLGYPLALMAVEKQLQYGEMTRRFDLVLFDRSGSAQMIIECKEMNVPLTEEVLSQALRYNMVVKAPILVITNGIHCMAVRFNGASHELLYSIPPFEK
jgi:hypothetical protein